MRITGGSLRGRVVPGKVRPGVRPTSSRVREALFSMVGQDLEGVRVLDAFGGSGLLSFEAYSRGAIVTTVGTTITVTGECADFDTAAAAAALAADLGVSVSQITVTTSCDDGRRRRLDGSFTVGIEIVVETPRGTDDPAVSGIVSALEQTGTTASAPLRSSPRAVAACRARPVANWDL